MLFELTHADLRACAYRELSCVREVVLLRGNAYLFAACPHCGRQVLQQAISASTEDNARACLGALDHVRGCPPWPGRGP